MPCNWVKTDIENAKRTIEQLKVKESSLLKRIVTLEQVDEDNKNKIKSLRKIIENLKSYNKVILDQLSYEANLNNPEGQKAVSLPTPSFVKVSKYEEMLGTEDALGMSLTSITDF